MAQVALAGLAPASPQLRTGAPAPTTWLTWFQVLSPWLGLSWECALAGQGSSEPGPPEAACAPSSGPGGYRKPLACTLSAAHACLWEPVAPLSLSSMAFPTHCCWLFPNLALEVDLSFLFQVLFNCISLYYKRSTEVNEFPDLAG